MNRKFLNLLLQVFVCLLDFPVVLSILILDSKHGRTFKILLKAGFSRTCLLFIGRGKVELHGPLSQLSCWELAFIGVL